MLIYLPPHLSPHTPSMPKGVEKEERLVYQLIEAAGNKGIWIRDIRREANMTDNVVNKTVKTLESKMLIKTIKSVPASKKKMYILYDVCPDEAVTGGAWYSDQEFESEFVEVLNQHCLKFLQQKVKGGGGGWRERERERERKSMTKVLRLDFFSKAVVHIEQFSNLIDASFAAAFTSVLRCRQNSGQ